MMYPTSSRSEDLDFFQLVDECPEVKEKLRRGVKLDELSKIRQFLENNHVDSYFRKTYGFIIDGINLIRDFRMDEIPSAHPDTYISTVDHWVGITGYYNVGLDQLAYDHMESKFIINVLALRTRMLIMNTDAYRIFKMLVALRPKTNRIILLRVALIALHLLYESGAPFSVFMTPSHVKYLWYRFGYLAQDSLFDDALVAFNILKDSGKVSDEFGLVEKLLKEYNCIPSSTAFVDDGWYHFMTVPTWTLGVSPYTGVDYTGNYITDWGYLVTTE